MTPENLTRRRMLMSSLLLPLAAGGATIPSPSAAAKLAEGRMLVAYFSRRGNTRVVAGRVSLALGANLFEIKPQHPYPADYFEAVQQAKLETDRGFEPPLTAKVPGIAQYNPRSSRSFRCTADVQSHPDCGRSRGLAQTPAIRSSGRKARRRKALSMAAYQRLTKA